MLWTAQAHRSYIFITLICVVISLGACRPERGLDPLPTVSCRFSLQYPDNLTELSLQQQEIVLTNKGNGVETRYTSLDSISTIVGLYDISYTADCTFSLKGVSMRGRLVSRLADVTILQQEGGESVELLLPLRIVPTVSDFVIQEIFFTGTLTPAGKQYHGDNYVVLYNGTDHTLYADGIAFCESRFISTRKYDYKPDIRHEAMAVQAVYVVPGSGKEVAVPPGGRLLLCDTGIDHRTNNPNSFDLSQASFEWYDVSTVPAHQDFDSPLVPNLDKWYCYTKSFFVLHNRGFRSYVIARMPVDKEIYLKEYVYDFTWVLTHAGVSYDMSGSCYKLPNEWILDGVNCSVEANLQWLVLPETLDAGYTHCGTMDHQKDRYFHSVRRKYLGRDALGNPILQDTNNSSEDFNPMVTPALVEEQGAAIDAKGTPCTSRTYDGVIPYESSNDRPTSDR